MMHLVSVNVGLPKSVTFGGETRRTAIVKLPVDGPVEVNPLGLKGDGQGNRKVHGGVDKAVYAYPKEHYEYWQEARDESYTWGHFGDNLTVAGMLEDEVRIGDVLRCGTAELQVSEPRQPCPTLAFRMQDATFPKTFLRSGRVGYYLRVLEPGTVCAGDSIERLRRGPQAVTMQRFVDLVFFGSQDLETARAAVELEALSSKWRQAIAERLATIA